MATAPLNRTGSRHTTPQLVTDTTGAFQYGLWCDLTGNVYAFRRNLWDDSRQTIDLSTVVSNHLNLPLEDITDDHWCFSCMIGGDGVFHVFCNQRNESPFRYVRCTNVSAFTTVGSWVTGGTPFSALSSGSPEGGSTYSMWDRLSDGTPILFCSQPEYEDSPMSRGMDWIAHKWTGGAWVKLTNHTDAHFVTSEDTGDPGDGTANRAYMWGMTVQPGAGTSGADRIHAAYAFRTAAEDADSQGYAGYVVSDDAGATWKTAGGAAVTIPITWANKASSQISSAPSIIPLSRVGIYVDQQGYPHMAFDSSGALANPDAYKEYYWDGSAWQQGSTSYSAPVMWHWIKGARWRQDRSSFKIRLVNETTGAAVWMSHVTNGLEANADPIKLRYFGEFEIIVPDGDDLQSVLLGDRAPLHGVLMDDLLVLQQGGQLLLTDGTDLLLASSEVEVPPDEPGYYIEGRRLIRIET